MRQIVLDTETTGIDPASGHRIIEIGCIEMIDRKLTGNHYHQYINPERVVEDEAIAVHGITNEFLADKPVFSTIAAEFFEFVKGAELVIHNAPFDVGFINHEFKKLGAANPGNIDSHCAILDTLQMARKKHPGQKNNLDALCKRYFIKNDHRTLHGALLDSEILAEVYLAMTGGQTALSLAADENAGPGSGDDAQIQKVDLSKFELPVITASEEEKAAHEQLLNLLDKKSEGAIWRKL